MDGRLAVLFLVMSLFGEGFEREGFNIKRADFGNRIVVSGGLLRFEGENVGQEFRLSYAPSKKWGRVNPMFDFSITDQGGVWIGFGLYQQFDIEIGNVDTFAGFYFVPGFYARGSEVDLGFPLEFRSGIEFGIRLKNNWQVSLSFDHRSNGDIAAYNPGVETLQLRISKPIGQ